MDLEPSAPDRVHSSRKRRSEQDHYSPPHGLTIKRTKARTGLQDFTKKDQLVLKAAAMILDVPPNRLLALKNTPAASSITTSLDQSELFSSSSSDDQESTPSGSSESGPIIDLFGTSTVDLSQTGFQEHSGSSNIPITWPEHTTIQQNGFVLPWHPGHDVSVESQTGPLAVHPGMYPTPPASQYNPDRDSNGPDWMLEQWQHLQSTSGYMWGQQGLLNDPTLDQSAFLEIVRTSNNSIIPENRSFADSVQCHNQYSPTSDLSRLTGVAIQENTQQNRDAKVAATKGKRRGRFPSEAKRQQTAETRKLGACIRCRLHRIGCDLDLNKPSESCLTCFRAVQRESRQLPCLRYKITDTELLDNEQSPRRAWTTRWKNMEMIDITNWASDTVKTIEITQGVGKTSYFLRVREFVPIEGDALARRRVIDGKEYEYGCTPYAVADMKEAGKVLRAFSEQTLTTAIPFYVKKNTLLHKTYNMAYQYSKTAESPKERHLLELTLRLWAASRMMSRSAYICGPETLGMIRRDFGPNSPDTGKILMPPVFSAQMEIIFVSQVLQPTKKNILNKLYALMDEKQRSSWLTIYLCIFLLLHSCALLTAKDHERANLQGIKVI